MPRTIVFFVASRVLVFPDDVALVLVDREHRRHTSLALALGVEPVKIHGRRSLLTDRRIAFQRAITLGSGTINAVGMGIGSRRKIDFGARYVEKTQRIDGQSACFLGVDHVIWDRSDARRHSRIWAKRTEGLYSSHRELPIISM